MATEVISRKDARAKGLSRYFTSKPCKYGHVSERFVAACNCCACDLLWQRGRLANDEDFRERHNEYKREHWHATPLKQRRAKKRSWYKANRSHAIEYTTQWVQENSEWAKATFSVISARNRAAKLGRKGEHSAEELLALLEQQKYRCAYCEVDLRSLQPKQCHVDHIVPLTNKKATDSISNCQWVCNSCNSRKSNRSHRDFMAEMGK